MSWPITAAACSTPAVRPRSYDAGWAKLREDDAGLGPVTPGCPGRLRRQHALRQAVRPRWRPACTTHQLHGWGLRLNRPPGGADANEPWTVSRTNTYRGAGRQYGWRGVGGLQPWEYGHGSCMDGARGAREKNLTFRETIRVQSCIRPLSAAVLAAGPDVIR